MTIQKTRGMGTLILQMTPMEEKKRKRRKTGRIHTTSTGIGEVMETGRHQADQDSRVGVQTV